METKLPTAESQVPSDQTDYRLGAGDVLAISVLGLKDFDCSVAVSNSGKVHVPHLGVIAVLDLTPAQMEAEIARRLREQGLMKEPWVRVRVTDYRSQTVYILGEVIMPGQYLLKEDMCVMDLISLGLGLNDVTNRSVYLYRQHPAPSKGVTPPDRADMYEVTSIDLQELFAGKKPELNVRLRGGDILYCPEKKAEYFYAMGDLNRPGAIEIPQGSQVLVSRAISWAGGATKTAKVSKGILMRYDETGARQQLAVDFKAVLTGKKPDFLIKPNDIIYIPGSSAKALGYGMLGVIPGVAQGAALIR
jgi:protein involved in polysaccharide export with SLBB domain